MYGLWPRTAVVFVDPRKEWGQSKNKTPHSAVPNVFTGEEQWPVKYRDHLKNPRKGQQQR